MFDADSLGDDDDLVVAGVGSLSCARVHGRGTRLQGDMSTISFNSGRLRFSALST